MATRVNRKNPNTATFKEVVNAEKVPKNECPDEASSESGVSTKTNPTPLGKKIPVRSRKQDKNPAAGIKVRAKTKQTGKLRKNLKRKIIQNSKSSENRDKRLRNGLRDRKIAKIKTKIRKQKNDAPPVLEPIIPFVENSNTPVKLKTRTKKQVDDSQVLNVKKIRKKRVNKTLNLEKQSIKKEMKNQRNCKNIKGLNETAEETMNDLSFLIKKEELKTEVDSTSESGISDVSKGKKMTRKQKIEPFEYESYEEMDVQPIIKQEDIKLELDPVSDSEKSDILKPKKITRNQRIELLKKQLKKENFEKTVDKIDEVDKKLIDVLDLNVGKMLKKSVSKRRHSIEKFPMGSIDAGDISISHLFNHLPRNMSLRSKRYAKVRKSNDSISRRSSPYSTRSDSPARILRNGKQRKWTDLNLVDGLDIDNRKRRRLCSDLSGSEMSVSKLSEYESDSSFSDLASTHGAENTEDVLAKSSLKESFEEAPVEVPSSDVEKSSCKKIEIVDTNSNVCNNFNKFELKKDAQGSNESDSSDVKVPDKLVILDIMKQAFNEPVCDKSVIPPVEPIESDPQITEAPSLTLEKCESTQKKDSCSENNFKFDENKPQYVNIDILNNFGEGSSKIMAEFEEDTPDDEQKDELVNIISHIVENDIQMEDEPIAPSNTIENNCELLESENKSPQSNDIFPEDSKIDNEEIVEHVENVEQKESLPIENEKIEEHTGQSPEIENEIVTEIVSQEPELEPVINDSDDTEKEDTSAGLSKDDLIKDSKVADNEKDKADLDNDTVDKADLDNGTVHESASESSMDILEKESILKALGLQSLRAIEHTKQVSDETYSSRNDTYTGTLKTVIKLNRDKKKGPRITSIKTPLQSYKNKGNSQESLVTEELSCTDYKDGLSKQEASYSVDSAGAHRKSHYSNRSNLESPNEQISDGEGTSQDGTIKALVIPEKASSFSIHPGRLCKDECSYCFGKFGLFDTPCHIAQMKSVERQDKILSTEKHLTRDSCLCDACYRHVDRKSNAPSYMNKSLKRNSLVAPGPKENHCHVLGCHKLATNILRRKWIIKMKKNICQVINIDLDNPGLHSIPICENHYSALEHLMICSMCKRRLARNHIHYLGPETNALNNALTTEGIPITLTDKPVVCKLCKCFASIILKDAEERSENSISFFNEYKRRLLHFNDILPMDESAAEEPISFPSKTEKSDQIKKKKKLEKSSSQSSMENLDEKNDRLHSSDTNNETKSRSESPTDEYNVVDYNTLIPAIAMDCGSDTESKKEPPKTEPLILKKISQIDKKEDAVQISKVYNPTITKHTSDIAVQKLGSNPSISVRQLFPGEEDLPLDVHIDFNNVKDQTPEGWEKSTSVIQYDAETKKLWQELQKPYGNQSSFLRHLVLLEKYFRNGDLVLSAKASHHSINYSESVHNRLRAYDNIPSSAKNVQPLSMIPFNKFHEKHTKEAVTCTSIGSASITNPQKSIAITAVNKILSNNLNRPPNTMAQRVTKTNPALTITQLNNPMLTSGSTVLQQIRPKMTTAPPGLISLHPGTTRPVGPLVKVPQSQKIKFPITKNWRPNLIPIDPTKKQERKTGLVQVISGGKPYHITLEDYKKMCAIKRSFEMRQKRLQDVQNGKSILVTHNSVLKSITPRKGLIISKTVAPNGPVKMEPQVLTADNIGNNDNIIKKLESESVEMKICEKSSLPLPRIPKSLTVIPQSVSKPSSPVLEITPKVLSKS